MQNSEKQLVAALLEKKRYQDTKRLFAQICQNNDHDVEAWIGLVKICAQTGDFSEAEHGEAFNLPVLEAAACGLPVICTKGGPTDEFTNSEFALPINAELCREVGPTGEPGMFFNPDQDHLTALMETVIEDDEWRKRARLAGPAWVSSRYTWKHAVDKLLPVLLD